MSLKHKKLWIICILFSMVLYTIFHFQFFRTEDYDISIFRLPTRCTNCSKVTIDELIAYGRNNTFPNGIPRIVHYNYKSRVVPMQYVPLVTECLRINPSVRFIIWSDLSSYELIQNRFKTHFRTFQSHFQKKSDPLKKSDLSRYFILQLFGGIYMDLDTRCQRPMGEAMNNESCILSKEVELQSRILSDRDFYAMNSFMACVPGHAFFSFLVDRIPVDANVGPILLTGPRFLTEQFLQYNKTLTSENLRDPTKVVSIPSSDLFSPLITDDLPAYCNSQWSHWRKVGCRDLASYKKVMEEKIAKAIVVHLFYHLGYSVHYSKIQTLYDLTDIERIAIISDDDVALVT